MNCVVHFWKKLNREKKIQKLFFTISMIVLIVTYIPSFFLVKKNREKEIIQNEKIDIDYNVLSYVESITQDDNEMVFSGWVLPLHSELQEVELILRAIETSDVEIASVRTYAKSDIVDIFTEKKKKSNCGVEAKILKKKIDENVCYEIIFSVSYTDEFYQENNVENGQKIKVFTGQYLLDGQIYWHNPNKFVMPMLRDKELVEVVEKGVLKVYDEKEKVWIYQYENELYMITQRDDYISESNISVPVLAYTSDVVFLPEYRRQYGYDHWGTYYEEKNEGLLPYQVVKIPLSREFPLTYINTGLYSTVSQKWIANYQIPIIEWNLR